MLHARFSPKPWKYESPYEYVWELAVLPVSRVSPTRTKTSWARTGHGARASPNRLRNRMHKRVLPMPASSIQKSDTCFFTDKTGTVFTGRISY
jgi:hypothetical protein